MIELHGRDSSYALGWKDLNSQQVRFKAPAGIADLSDHTVLDAGCGYGDLLSCLSGIYKGIKYTGIEQIPALFDKANKRHGHLTNVSFIPGNFTTMDLPVSDYVFASGSLNYRSADAEFIFKMIRKLYAACRIGFAFNLLSQIIPNGLIVAYDPEQIIHFCESLCPLCKARKRL